MEKVLQLLNEYQTQRGSKFKFSSYDANSSAFIIEKNPRMVLGEETILSKKFGFIQWLVVNDKIDKDRADNILYETDMFNRDPYTDFMDRLLMYLSIQDDPIHFLVSVLK